MKKLILACILLWLPVLSYCDYQVTVDNYVIKVTPKSLEFDQRMLKNKQFIIGRAGNTVEITRKGENVIIDRNVIKMWKPNRTYDGFRYNYDIYKAEYTNYIYTYYPDKNTVIYYVTIKKSKELPDLFKQCMTTFKRNKK